MFTSGVFILVGNGNSGSPYGIDEGVDGLEGIVESGTFGVTCL